MDWLEEYLLKNKINLDRKYEEYFICKCGSKIKNKSFNKYQHKKTKKHILYLKNIDNEVSIFKN